MILLNVVEHYSNFFEFILLCDSEVFAPKFCVRLGAEFNLPIKGSVEFRLKINGAGEIIEAGGFQPNPAAVRTLLVLLTLFINN